MAESTSDISITSNKVATGILFGIALIAYAARTYIRTFVVKQFLVEDGLLLFALVSLCGTTGLAFRNMKLLYNVLGISLHGLDLGLLLDASHQIPGISRGNSAAFTLGLCVIYPVKLAFLFFFRRLAVRLPRLYAWWWLALTLTILAWVAAVVAVWLTCPFTSITKVLSCYGPAGNSRVIRDTAAATAIDVITDIMVLSFPIILLWEVRVDVRQKFALGISLCLSIVMIVVAIIRISAFRLTNGEVDMVWLAFWQQQESSIAITVVSISAFRSLFVAASVNGPIRRPFRQSVNEWRRKVERRRIGPTTNDQEMPVFGTLPRVPSPTLTGMSSLLRRL